jgi:Phage gp6-like head-tail connector protein
MYVDLKTVKKHLQIDEDYLDDDAYLLMLISVAEDSVATHLDIDLKEIAVESAMEVAYNEPTILAATPEITTIVVAGKKRLKEIDSNLIETQSDNSSDNTVTTLNLPAAIQHAILLMVGNLYNNREPVSYNSVVTIPYTLEYLLGLYKNYSPKH